MQLSIVRHGATAANASGLLQGRIDNPLNENGIKQAEQIAVALSSAAVPIDRVISSPLSRAINTAAPFATANDLKIETDERWIELDYGDWESRLSKDVRPAEWQAWRGDAGFAPPSGESLQALETRVRKVCEEIATDQAAKHVAVFTHVSPIKAAIGWALGIEPSASVAMSWRMHVAQAQITTIAVSAGVFSTGQSSAESLAESLLVEPRLIAFNSTSHLTG